MKLVTGFIFLLAISGHASAGTCTQVTSVPQTLTDGSYCLSFDVTTGGSAFSLEPNTTLDCKGHRIRASADGNYGIYASGSNVTIKNCTVSGFREGIVLNAVNNYRLINNRVESVSTSSRGIHVSGLTNSNGLIQRNQIINQAKLNNHYWGIFIDRGNVDLIDNVVSNAIAIQGSGASMYGIMSNNNYGGLVARNIVRNVIPDTGHQGISITLQYGRASLRENIVVNALSGGDMSYFCYSGQFTTAGVIRQSC